MTTAPAPRRHALGLPAGSVRALLGLSVLAMMWGIALRNPNVLPPVFIYLSFLKVVILTHYFTAHQRTMGKNVGSRPALGLPRGTIRFLMLGGFVGLIGYLWSNKPRIEMPTDPQQLYSVIGLLVIGFFVGYVLTHLFRSQDGQIPMWLQDVQAWLALLAGVGLGVLVIIYAVINTSLPEGEQLNIGRAEAGLAGLVGFYFGART